MKQLNPFQNFLFQAGGVLLLIGASMTLFQLFRSWSPFIYTIGAVLFTTMQMMASYEGQNIVIRRLRRQQLIGSAFLLAAAALMFMSLYQVAPFQADEWKLALTIGAVLETYTAFRIPAELQKEEQP